MKPNPVVRSKIRHHRLRGVIALALIVLSGIISWWYLFLRTAVVSEDAYVSGNIIPIQAQVPGIVSKIGVDNSMAVQTGQWLLSEERNLTGAKMERAAANLAEAVRSTKSLFAQAEGEAAEIATLEAGRRRLAADLERYQAAEPSGAVSAQQVSDTKAEIAVTDGRIAKARALLRKAQALVSGTTVAENPQVLKARAEYIESYIGFHRSSLFSPVTGYVAARRVQAGEMVQTGQRLMSVVPLDALWITANLKETRLSRVRTGEAVKIRAHAYGSEFTFHGRVIGMAPSGGSTFSLFPPNNATGNYIHIVERVPVRISLSQAELKSHPLRPGMSVTVEIETGNFRSLPLLATEVDASSASYSTSLYRNEMLEAQQFAQKIIESN